MRIITLPTIVWFIIAALIWAVITACLCVLDAQTAKAAWTAKDAVCDHIDGHKGYIARPFIPPVKIRRNKHNCKDYACFYEHAPKNRRSISVYYSRKAEPRVTWGTAGWTKTVIVIPHESYFLSAYLLSMGVELSSLLKKQDRIKGDLLHHYEFVEEMWCLLDNGQPQLGFGESAPVPDPKIYNAELYFNDLN